MHQIIPASWRIQRSTPFFTVDNVPRALLSHHNTASGVFGQICVMAGRVTYYGFADEKTEEPEQVIVIEAGEFTTTPPQYWHKVELSDDAQFNINFWSEPKN
ncbi:MAG TPA: cytoplasmic protein [Porticoccaceae bacterium]|nr:cytoplasmic protein [Porticoccaceae bacterium]